MRSLVVPRTSVEPANSSSRRFDVSWWSSSPSSDIPEARSVFAREVSSFELNFLNPKDTRLFVTNSKTVCHMWQTVLFCDINFLVPCDICDTDPGTQSSFTFQFPVEINPTKTGPKTGPKSRHYVFFSRNSPIFFVSLFSKTGIENTILRITNKSESLCSARAL